MADSPRPNNRASVATSLVDSVGLLSRRLRSLPVAGELTPAEATALGRLARTESATAADLARAENVTPQSIGATLSALERRGLVARRRDASDGRRILLTVTRAGLEVTRAKRDARGEQIAIALAGFTDEELDQLLAAAPLLEQLARELR
jgi:DNA-binding MarR family transcriptional regulator